MNEGDSDGLTYEYRHNGQDAEGRWQWWPGRGPGSVWNPADRDKLKVQRRLVGAWEDVQHRSVPPGSKQQPQEDA